MILKIFLVCNVVKGWYLVCENLILLNQLAIHVIWLTASYSGRTIAGK